MSTWLACRPVSTFIEAVTASSVEEEARAILATKPNMRVVVPATDAGRGDGPPGDLEFRSMIGGVLVQSRDEVREAHTPWPGAGGLKVVTRRQPTAGEWQALRFAWRICAHVKSNAVMFATADRTIAIGVGQMSRVER